MYSTTDDDDYPLPANFEKMLRLFDGVQLRAQLYDVVKTAPDERAFVESLIRTHVPLVAQAGISDFETAYAIGSNMMLAMYPEAWILRGPRYHKNAFPTPEELGLERQFAFAQQVLSKSLGAISILDKDTVVKEFAERLQSTIPYPDGRMRSKSMEGVEFPTY